MNYSYYTNYFNKNQKTEVEDKTEDEDPGESKIIFFKTHPVLFIFIIILFFITINLWNTTIHKTLDYFHPKGYLNYLEYLFFSHFIFSPFVINII